MNDLQAEPAPNFRDAWRVVLVNEEADHLPGRLVEGSCKRLVGQFADDHRPPSGTLITGRKAWGNGPAGSEPASRSAGGLVEEIEKPSRGYEQDCVIPLNLREPAVSGDQVVHGAQMSGRQHIVTLRITADRNDGGRRHVNDLRLGTEEEIDSSHVLFSNAVRAAYPPATQLLRSLLDDAFGGN